MRLLVGVPSNRPHEPAFVSSLLAMVRYADRNGVNGTPPGALAVAIKTQVSNLPHGRQSLLTDAILGGYTHLLFLDDDMTFPENLLDYLCSHDLPVVAANCPRKVPERLLYTALDCRGRMLRSKGEAGIEQVSKVGTGIMLIKLEALRGIPAPHFDMPWVPVRHRYRGEDFTFCTVLGKAGVQIFVDHDLSNKIGHVGSFTYQFDTWGTVEEVRAQAVAEYRAKTEPEAA